MKSRGALPRRRKPSPAARLRRFWLPLFLFVVLAGGGTAALVTWPGFSPRSVVVTGNRIVPTAEIVAAAAVAPHVNMWMQNPHAIARRIEDIPYVDRARVLRVPPATVEIQIVERAPFAVVRSGLAAALVDRSLRVLADGGDASDVAVLVVRPGLQLTPGAFIEDSGAEQLRDAYAAMLAAHVVPSQLALDRYGGVVVTMPGGVRVLLGDDDDMTRKLALVDPILAQVARSGRRIAAIDLRAPNTPVVDYR
ncbi:MAG TPA: FtsQ-type POTRA domain-containing protein [Candidatus Acidoferrales bacterium]|nr:FtsQ-type POTRA domain-containing protein [Candidatus Acidoferrales bacterium]